MADEKELTINEEAGLSDNWHPVDVPPIRPGVSGGAPPSPNALPAYFQGSISPNMQHDSDFTNTKLQTPRIPQVPLMPVAPSGNPQNNAAIQSAIIENTKAAVVAAGGMTFKGVWLAFAKYSVGNVVLFNSSAYVASTGSVNAQPDLNPTNWTLLSENFVFGAGANVGFTAGWGAFDKEAQAFASSNTASVGPLTPANANTMMMWLLADQDSSASVSGWLNLLNVTGVNMLLKNNSTQSPTTPSLTLAGSEAWANALLFFNFGGTSLTASITAVSLTSNVVTIVCNTNNNFTVGQTVKISGVTNAAFLNGTTLNILSVTGTAITAALTHANYALTADTGTVTNLQYIQASSPISGALTGTKTAVFASMTKGNTIVVVEYSRSTTGNAGVSPNSYSDTQGNTYHSYDVGTYGTGGSPGAAVHVAYATNIAGGANTVSMVTGALETNAYFQVFEFPDNIQPLTKFLPYDVEEFKGSFFVCIAETATDAFTSPSDWAQIAQGSGAVDALSANYTAVATDYGRLISNSTSSTYTVTLPATPPSNSWWIALQAFGSGSIIVNPNGGFLDGSTSNITLVPMQGIFIFTDGSQYYTIRGSSGSSGGVNVQTSSYAAVLGDSGKLISMNASSGTLTLPNPPPTSIWWIAVENINASNLTISRNGLTIDGAASNLTLGQNQGVIIYTDGSNYYTLHGVNRLTVPSFLTASAPDGSGNVTIASATVSPSFAVIGPTVCAGSGPLTARQIQGSDLANLSISSVSQTGNGTTQSGNIRLCGSVLPAGLYRISAYVVVTTVGAGNIGATITWNDGTASQSVSPATVSTTVLGTVFQFNLTILADGVHDVTYAFTLS